MTIPASSLNALASATPVPGLPAELHMFSLLRDPANYVACRWDLSAHARERAYWIGLFRRHMPRMVHEGLLEAADAGVPEREAKLAYENATKDFFAYLDHVEKFPAAFGRLDIQEICYARERALRAQGIADPYRFTKQKENASALALLPAMLKQIDALPEAERLDRLTRGVFAGNIFDLGAVKTLELFREGKVDFQDTLSKLKPRPWFVDHLDAWIDRLTRGPKHRCAILFVDNAGFDVLLGMIPLGRELLRRGTDVIFTANPNPSLNDITHDELSKLMTDIASWDDVIGKAVKENRMELVHSGNGAPLIDLARISPELDAAAKRRGADLVIIEGMGRAIESNFDAQFKCDAMKIAMIKDEGVAEAMGCSVYDLVLRFDRV